MNSTKIPYEVLLKNSIYSIEGLIIFVSNSLFILTILRHAALRELKELLVVSSLSLFDAISGLGTLVAGLQRNGLILFPTHRKMTGWECFLTLPNICWTFAIPLQGVQLLVVSLDRLCSVLWPFEYIAWEGKYTALLLGPSFLFAPIQFVLGAISAKTLQEPSISPVCLMGWALSPVYYQFIFTVQTISTVASVCVYGVTVAVYNKNVNAVWSINQNSQLEFQKRLTKSVGVSCVYTVILAVLPIFVNQLAFAFEFHYSLIAMWSFILSQINPMLNLAIYVKRHAEIRKGLKALLNCKTMPDALENWNVEQ